MDALPYYKWYWIDYRANRKVQRMSWQARGLYRELLDEFWAEGVIPNDTEALADVCGCDHAEFLVYWTEIQPSWDVTENGLVNAKMESQRTELDKVRAIKARAGSKGGKASNSLTRAKQEQADAKHMLSTCKQTQAEPDIAEQSRAEHKQRKATTPRGKREDTASRPEELPPYVDRTAWDAYVEMRRKKRCPMTPRARELILAKLEELREAGDDPSAVLDQSVMNGYQGIFALKGGSSNGTNRKYLEQQAALDEGFRQFDQRYAAQNANAGTKGVLSVTDATPGYRP